MTKADELRAGALRESYPYFLAGRPESPNADLEVVASRQVVTDFTDVGMDLVVSGTAVVSRCWCLGT